jgi:hypothetical protein
MGPFGSYRSPLEIRVPLWIGNMTMAYFFYSLSGLSETGLPRERGFRASRHG